MQGAFADEEADRLRVVQLPDGAKDVCAAVLLPHSLEEVWEAVTDYDHYGDICSFIRATDVTRGPDGCKVVGRAKTPLPGDIPFTIELKHEQELFEYRSTWDEASGDVLVNRGGWVARPMGDRETLLLIRLEVQVRGVPTFLLRNLSRFIACARRCCAGRCKTADGTARPGRSRE